MHHLERFDSTVPRRGMNRTTALALLAALAVFSTIVFFGIANAMLPDRSSAAELDGETPAGRVPALESPDGTEAVARRLDPAEEVGESPSADEAADGDEAATDQSPAPRTTRGHGHGAQRGTPARTGPTGETRQAQPRNPVRDPSCDASDPLCGVDFGSGLDA